LSFFVYVIQSDCSQKTYIGQTGDLEKRIIQHNDPDNKSSLFTKRYKGPWRLVHSEEFESRSKAVAREQYFKSGSGRRYLKKVLQMAVNPPAGKDSVNS
jgi:putative endonuclease